MAKVKKMALGGVGIPNTSVGAPNIPKRPNPMPPQVGSRPAPMPPPAPVGKPMRPNPTAQPPMPALKGGPTAPVNQGALNNIANMLGSAKFKPSPAMASNTPIGPIKGGPTAPVNQGILDNIANMLGSAKFKPSPAMQPPAPIKPMPPPMSSALSSVPRKTRSIGLEEQNQLMGVSRKPFEMKKGGAVKSLSVKSKVSTASNRGDGIAQRGKTKGRFV
jgi:hypothetical protein